jgi:trans-aconitate methyltransferase
MESHYNSAFVRRRLLKPAGPKSYDTMFRDILEIAQMRRFHMLVEDRHLDAAALNAGCTSGLGRLSLLSDERVGAIINNLDYQEARRIVDFGCGRGFAGRYLLSSDYGGCYVGVDRIASALDAANASVPGGNFVETDFHQHRWENNFDAALAFEVTRSGIVEEPLLQAVASALRRGGKFAVTVASTDGKLERRFDNIHELCSRYFQTASIENTTVKSTRFAEDFYNAILAITEWHPTVAHSLYREANAILRAIVERRFEYAIVTGTM